MLKNRLSVFLLGLTLGLMPAYLIGCEVGPKVTVYISDPDRGGMEYYDAQGNSGFVPYSVTDKYVAFSPADAQTLLNYCGIDKQQ